MVSLFRKSDTAPCKTACPAHIFQKTEEMNRNESDSEEGYKMNGEERHNKAKKVARSGMLIALAFIFGYVEMLFPFSIGIPGVKIGLANLAILSCLYLFHPCEVFLILAVRIVLSGFLFGNMASILYSLAGGILSFLGMWIGKNLAKLPIEIVSMLGGILHNIGQLVLAAFVLSSAGVFLYLPVLLLSGGGFGLLIGAGTKQCLRILKRQEV